MRALILALTTAAALSPAAALAAPPQPPLSAMALQLTDLPAGARVTNEGYSKSSGFVADYQRSFAFSGVRLGRSRPSLAESDVGLHRSADDAAFDMFAVTLTLANPRGRTEIAREFAQAAGARQRVRARDVRFGHLRTPNVGDGAVAMQVTIHARRLRLQFVMSFVQVDRVFAALFVASRTHARVADVVPLLRAVAAHTRQALLPHATAPPAIFGTAAVGETLTASQGRWDAATLPRRYGYQWERCTATLSACATLPGATGQSYNVATADRRSVLRVQVEATNAVGTTTVFSAPTAVVP